MPTVHESENNELSCIVDSKSVTTVVAAVVGWLVGWLGWCLCVRLFVGVCSLQQRLVPFDGFLVRATVGWLVGWL